jgi:hypothetical protein
MNQAVIAIHGGAGTITRAAMDSAREREYIEALEQVLIAGQRVLADGGSAMDAVTEAVRLLEECPLFNAGKGAVLTHEGTYELDAAVMDGATLNAGAVACVTRLRNPVLAARAVMDHSEHVLFAGEGAEAFALSQGLELVSLDYYFTKARHEQWERARAVTGMALLDHDAAALATGKLAGQADPIDPDNKFGTVGAVARDAHGRHVDRRRHQQAGRPRRRHAGNRCRLLCGRCRGDLRYRHRRDVHPYRGRARRGRADALRRRDAGRSRAPRGDGKTPGYRRPRRTDRGRPRRQRHAAVQHRRHVSRPCPRGRAGDGGDLRLRRGFSHPGRNQASSIKGYQWLHPLLNPTLCCRRSAWYR